MLYRGFKIERVIYHNNVSRIEITHDGGHRIIAHQRVEYVISEAVAGFHWQQIGTADNITMAQQMVDRIATAAESSRETIRIAV